MLLAAASIEVAMTRRLLLRVVWLVVAVLLVASCTSGSSGGGPGGAAGGLPSGCDQQAPGPDAAPIAFVADGRAWAVGRRGGTPVCLFRVADPGPFQWGPRGDRVVLAGLEVKGVGSSASRPRGSLDPTMVAWGRPVGKAIAFVPPGGARLDKAAVGSQQVVRLRPPDRDLAYATVVYHPSGRAVAYVTREGPLWGLWMSTNVGQSATQLQTSRQPIGPIAFSFSGRNLYHTVQLAGGGWKVHSYNLLDRRATGTLWQGRGPVQRLVAPKEPGRTPRLALDVGRGCGDRQALLSRLDGGPGTPLLPDVGTPTSALGWLDASHVLVGAGGCGRPMALWVTDIDGGAPMRVADGAEQAAVRHPDPTPTPALPRFADRIQPAPA
jgi:hypothetical protein